MRLRALLPTRPAVCPILTRTRQTLGDAPTARNALKQDFLVGSEAVAQLSLVPAGWRELFKRFVCPDLEQRRRFFGFWSMAGFHGSGVLMEVAAALWRQAEVAALVGAANNGSSGDNFCSASGWEGASILGWRLLAGWH